MTARRIAFPLARHPEPLPRPPIASKLALAVSLALCAAATPALAQDPPARAGRIAYVSGPVSLAPAGADGWTQAPLNRPLAAGDRLWTDAGARDEAQFGPAVVRMDAGTLMSVLAADEGVTQLQLSQGRIDLHVRRIDPDSTVEVDTPNLAFVARAPGDYRIVVSPDGASTDVAVLRGGGDVYGDGNAYAVQAGQGYRFGGQDLQNLGAAPVQPYDDFDRWAFQRDARLDRAQSARFVPADLVGYEDLDDNGAWRTVPDYGTVWVPTRVAADWAPYHSGHWAWVDPWGWTWVDDQPWGYAVSHYGRWVSLDNRWAWVPAPVRERPVYAPALVAFVGAALALGGRNDGPGVGWFPLGPHDAYRPAYRASPAYVTRINVTNTFFGQGGPGGFIDHPERNRYANRGVPGALMAMPAAQFAGAAPANRFGRAVDPRMAMNAPLAMAPGVQPLPQSRFGAGPARGVPPADAQRRMGVARSLPAGLERPGGPAFAHAGGAGGRPNFGPGPAVPVRMLRPAAAVHAGVPPPRGAGAPQLAGRPGAVQERFAQPGQQGLAALPGQGPGHGPGQGRDQVQGAPHGAALPPASAPYPGRGQAPGSDGRRWAEAHGAPGAGSAPGRPVQESGHGDVAARGFAGPALQVGAGRPESVHGAGADHGFGRSAEQDMRAGGPAPQAAAGHAPREIEARGFGPQNRPPVHQAEAERPHADAPRPERHEERQAQPQPQPQPQPHRDAAPPQQHHEAVQQHHDEPHPQPQQHHDEPRPQPQQHHDEPHPQPQQHHDAPPPPQHQAGGGGHEQGHGHEHGH